MNARVLLLVCTVGAAFIPLFWHRCCEGSAICGTDVRGICRFPTLRIRTLQNSLSAIMRVLESQTAAWNRHDLERIMQGLLDFTGTNIFFRRQGDTRMANRHWSAIVRLINRRGARWASWIFPI